MHKLAPCKGGTGVDDAEGTLDSNISRISLIIRYFHVRQLADPYFIRATHDQKQFLEMPSNNSGKIKPPEDGGNFQIKSGAELFSVLNQPDMGPFQVGVEPADGIDIKMHEPRGFFPFLTDLFLITVVNEGNLVAGRLRLVWSFIAWPQFRAQAVVIFLPPT